VRPEIAKLKVELREGELLTLPTEPMHPSRYTAATGAERARRRWRFPVTPSGIEPGPNVTGERRSTGISTEGGAAERPEVTLDCHECNEALQTARDAMAMTRRLALVAENALLNGDLQRARLALVDLQEANARDGRRRNAARESR